jgi:CHAD domain-containing protein
MTIDFLLELLNTLYAGFSELLSLDPDGTTLLQLAGRLDPGPAIPDKKGRLPAARAWLAEQSGLNIPDGKEDELAGLLAYRRGPIKDRDRGEVFPDRPQFWAMLAALRLGGVLQRAAAGRISVGGVVSGPKGIEVLVSGDLTPDEMRIVLDEAGKRARSAWEATGFPRLVMVEVQGTDMEPFDAKSPALPGRIARPGLEPDDPLAEAGRKTLRYQFAEMLAHEAGTRRGEDIEDLHDMRVSVRRMRAAFELFGPAYHPKGIRPFIKSLQATGRALGGVRDLDVFIDKARNHQQSLPAEERSLIDPVLDAWSERREIARAEMLTYLNSAEYHAFKWAFNTFLFTSGMGARPVETFPPEPIRLRETAPKLIYARLGRVLAFEPLLVAATPVQLHALRIEFKRLRYAVEFFREVLGEESKLIVAEIKKLQDHLGDLNDADVAAHMLSDLLAGWDARQEKLPLDRRCSPEGVASYLAERHAERHRLMSTFGPVWAAFRSEEFRKALAASVAVL